MGTCTLANCCYFCIRAIWRSGINTGIFGGGGGGGGGGGTAMRAICICYDVASHDMLGENYTKSYRRLSHNFAIKPHKSLLNEPRFGGNPSAPPLSVLIPGDAP